MKKSSFGVILRPGRKAKAIEAGTGTMKVVDVVLLFLSHRSSSAGCYMYGAIGKFISLPDLSSFMISRRIRSHNSRFS
jgi:hypothetical protein